MKYAFVIFLSLPLFIFTSFCTDVVTKLVKYSVPPGKDLSDHVAWVVNVIVYLDFIFSFVYDLVDILIINFWSTSSHICSYFAGGSCFFSNLEGSHAESTWICMFCLLCV